MGPTTSIANAGRAMPCRSRAWRTYVPLTAQSFCARIALVPLTIHLDISEPHGLMASCLTQHAPTA